MPLNAQQTASKRKEMMPSAALGVRTWRNAFELQKDD